MWSCSTESLFESDNLNVIGTLPSQSNHTNIGEIHYHKGKQNKWSKQTEFSAESNQFEKYQKWE